MIKKILLTNRKITKQATMPLVFCGLCLVFVTGGSIIIGVPLHADFSDYDSWIGYLMFYGGFILFIAFVVDITYKLIYSFKKGGKKSNPLDVPEITGKYEK